MNFNSELVSVMHIDFNSCFASVEQQANPLLRGRPVAVAAYDSPGGCILAASIEAKKYGIKTGTKVNDAKKICPEIKILEPDPSKYRYVHKKLHKLLLDYTQHLSAKSIDEFVLHFPSKSQISKNYDLFLVAMQIKSRIKQEIGDYLTVSIGISTNRILAKLASNLEKPDGLRSIDIKNFEKIYKTIRLTDLNGIGFKNALRLQMSGIFTPWDFYKADPKRLRTAFRSVLADYWYFRLRGYEIDDIEFNRKSFGNSYAFPYHDGSLENLLPVLHKLVQKTGFRLRRGGFQAQGVAVWLRFKNGQFWAQSKKLSEPIFSSDEIYKQVFSLLEEAPNKPVHTLQESVFGLLPLESSQLKLFENDQKQRRLCQSLDKINKKWGDYTIFPAAMLGSEDQVKDRIAFGQVGVSLS